MNMPIKFPDEADVIAEDAAEFRSLSPAERIKCIRGLLNTGEFLIRNSSKAAFVREYDLNEERELRRLIREFVARHGG
jgi:hypothetical protein